MFYEPPGSIHQVSANASATKPARMLAMVFAKKGVPRSMPA
jgi:quercetin dioxygenase-like cupin family protein